MTAAVKKKRRRKPAPAKHIAARQYEEARATRYHLIRKLVVELGRIDVLCEWVLDKDRDAPLWFHEEMMYFQDAHDEGLVLAFRGARKTHYVTEARVIFEILRNPNVRILLTADAADQSKAILRAVKDHFENNDTLREIFGDYITDAPKWADGEIIVNKRTAVGLKEATVTAAGIETSLLGKHFDVVIGDDLVTEDNSFTEGQRNKVKSYFYKTLLGCLEPDGRMWIIGCLSGDSPVLMGDGIWKPIADVEPGERVWSYNVETRALERRCVEAMIPQGTAPIVNVKTARHSVRATINHPFLVVRDEGRRDNQASEIKAWDLEWTEAGELKEGDVIVTLSCIDDEGDIPAMDVGTFDAGFAWLFGFMFGDGWTIDCKSQRFDSKRGKSYPAHNFGFCIAKGEDDDLNKRVLAQVRAWCGSEMFETKSGYYRCNKADPSRQLIVLGLVGGAREKSIPDFVFRLPAHLKRQFIRGLIDADGWRQERGYAYRIELSSELLVCGVRDLAMTCGVRPTSIYYRKRLLQPPNSPMPVEAESWQVGLVFEDERPRQLSRCCVAHINRLGEGVRLDRVRSVVSCGEAPVFDLTVEGTHNFIADGMIVHNTRFDEEDLYGHLAADFFEPDAVFVLGILDGETDESVWEERFPTERMHRIRRGNLSAFELQWMCRAGVSLGGIFTEEHFKYYVTITEPYFTWQGVDLAIGTKSRNDFFAHVTVGVTKTAKEIYLLDFAERKMEFTKQVPFVNHKFRQHPDTVRVGIEANAYQIALTQQVRHEYPDIPVMPRYTQKDKVARAQQMAFTVTDRPIRVLKSQHKFIRRLCAFPGGPKDLFDAFDIAVGMGLRGVKKQRRSQEVGLI